MGEAAYLKLSRSGELGRRAAKAAELLGECVLCPRECRVDRTAGEKGVCGAGAEAEVSSYNAHFGEEPPISGDHGSGTIFLTHCNLRCVFCQNYPISHLGHGNPAPPERMAGMMLRLQDRDCHNINFVTPTHFMPQILAAVDIAAKDGLEIPIVYNCGGYESLAALELLDGVVDIYMPDMKYGGSEAPEEFSGCADYPERNREAVREMFRQAGPLEMDEGGIATRGLMVRHLVLPENLAESRKVLEFIARELSPDVYISVMEQYFPAYRAADHEKLGRGITRAEYKEVLDIVDELGFTNGWIQGDPTFLL